MYDVGSHLRPSSLALQRRTAQGLQVALSSTIFADGAKCLNWKTGRLEPLHEWLEDLEGAGDASDTNEEPSERQ